MSILDQGSMGDMIGICLVLAKWIKMGEGDKLVGFCRHEELHVAFVACGNEQVSEWQKW